MDSNIKQVDQKVFGLLTDEQERQEETLMMIPSENYASRAVMEALGSVFTNKYTEGYPGERYYQGVENYDLLENLAIDRAKELFGVPYVNVQPYSGSIANNAIYMALMNNGDKVMGLDLKSGGHLSHGLKKITFGGKFFDAVSYTVAEDGYLDYELVEKAVLEHKPKILVCGYSAYTRLIEFRKFAEIADKVGAWLLADISHVGGLVAGKMYPSPVLDADIVMTTTHKTLRGPRGAMIMVTEKGLNKDDQLGEKINKAVFPGLQGGPHNNQIAGLAVCLAEAKKSSFKLYAKKIVQNANVLASELSTLGWNLVTGGTDTHLILADVRNFDVSGKVVAVAMEIASMVMNANVIPFDSNSAKNPSGVRFGTPGLTTRGMGGVEMKKIAIFMNEVIEIVRGRGENFDGLYQEKKLRQVGEKVKALSKEFPVYGVEK